jgi:hypothetical protein
MSRKASDGERQSGAPRNVRFTDEEWGLVERWAQELGEKNNVAIKPAEILRKLIREEATRRNISIGQPLTPAGGA